MLTVIAPEGGIKDDGELWLGRDTLLTLTSDGRVHLYVNSTELLEIVNNEVINKPGVRNVHIASFDLSEKLK